MNGFPQNARVCFLGDSITHNNGYISYISAFYHKNFKERNINFYNCGVGGGRVQTLLHNFEDDIMAHNPTHAVIMIGINDSDSSYLFEPRSRERYEKLAAAFEIFKKNLSILCDKLKANNVEIILCTQTPYNEYYEAEKAAPPGALALMMGYAEYVRNFARENGFPLCDYQRFFIEKMQEEEIINPDRVHPSDLGQFYMAKCFLAFQGLDIGEKEPMPQYMSEWNELVLLYRKMRMTEDLVIKNYSLTTEERIEAVKKYIAEGEEDEYRSLFLEVSELYLENKPKQKEIEEKINNLMEIAFKN